MARQAQYTLSSKGRTFVRGEALGEEMQCAIVDKIINLGGDIWQLFFFLVVLLEWQIIFKYGLKRRERCGD
jgi:hypothetical protein